MSTKVDYYELLGVSRTADGDEIKRAYRKLAMQYHPDRNPGNAEAEHKFKEMSEAYQILSDAQKRAAYDRFGHGAFQQGGGASPFDFGFGGGGLSDILEEVFGEFMGGARSGGPSGNMAQRGRDLRHDVEITLEEAAAGVEKEIRVASQIVCETCHGSGGKPGTQPNTCKQCNGAGKIRLQQGFFLIERGCPVCNGIGKVIEHPCGTCHGQGRQHKQQHMHVAIPAGVDNGTRIRLTGKGEAGMRGGPSGDLYVFVALRPHTFFHRESANLMVRIPINVAQAALGGKLEVPTLDGKTAELNLPEGTQSGAQFRLKGLGMPLLQQTRSRSEPQRGDLFVEIAVETPVNLTKRQKELLKEFEAAFEPKKNSPQADVFLARLKEFLGVKQ
jgi:molecular chaperone DnaJ